MKLRRFKYTLSHFVNWLLRSGYTNGCSGKEKKIVETFCGKRLEMIYQSLFDCNLLQIELSYFFIVTNEMRERKKDSVKNTELQSLTDGDIEKLTQKNE